MRQFHDIRLVDAEQYIADDHHREDDNFGGQVEPHAELHVLVMFFGAHVTVIVVGGGAQLISGHFCHAVSLSLFHELPCSCKERAC